MREPDTGSAYMVRFKTSADHTLSDMHELVQNHEQELKAHAAVMKQAAERQNQLNAQLQMLYDTRMVTRVTGGVAELQAIHEQEQKEHEDEMARAAEHQVALTKYGQHLEVAGVSEQAHKDAEVEHQQAIHLLKIHKAKADAAEAEHNKNIDNLNMAKPAKYKDTAQLTAQPRVLSYVTVARGTPAGRGRNNNTGRSRGVGGR